MKANAGETLETWIEENNFSVQRVCDFLKISKKEYFDFLRGEHQINPEDLEELTGISHRVWILKNET
jgi:predicted XRE-type DNA-binding protein